MSEVFYTVVRGLPLAFGLLVGALLAAAAYAAWAASVMGLVKVPRAAAMVLWGSVMALLLLGLSYVAGMQ